MAWIKNIAGSLVVFFGVVFIVLLDLYLGPEFMGSYAESQGKGSTWWTTLIPWALSIATTGFQYLLKQAGLAFRTKQRSIGRYGLMVVGALVAICDSLTDVGGLTSLTYGHEQGVKVKPDGADGMWWIAAVMVFIICLGHEYLLDWLLTRKGSLAMASPGTGLLLKTVDLTAWLFFFFRDVAALCGYAGVLALDVFLTGYFIHAKTEESEHFSSLAVPAAIMISVVLLLCQFGLVLRMRTGSASWKHPQFWIVIVLLVLDTGTDVGGMTAFLYGPENMQYVVVPAQPNMAWWLIVGCIALLCAICEPMVEEVSAVAGGVGKSGKSKVDKQLASASDDPFAGMPPMPSEPPSADGFEDLLRKM